MKSIGIIGSGIAGLSTAYLLDQNQFAISIFDKKPEVGGRIRTHKINEYQFDLGAQYIESTTSPFRLVLEEWEERDVISQWEGKIGELQGSKFVNRFPEKVYVGTPKMSTIGSYLSSHLDHVKFNMEIEIVEVFKKFNEWYLVDKDDEIHGGFDFLVIAIPPSNAISLLSDFKYLVEILNEVEVSPRWAVMIALSHRLNIDYDAVFVKNSPIRWMARNNSKPGRNDKEAWIVHTNKVWSKNNLNRKEIWVAERIYKEFLKISGFDDYTAEFKKAYLWNEGIVEKSLNQNFILDNNRNIALVGDYCMGKNIEAAYLSGQNLGNRLNNLRL